MYKFIDVTEQQGSDALPSEALKINGQYIENLVPGYRTLHVSGRELLSSEIEDLQIGVSDGSRYQRKRIPSRIIIVTYQLFAKTNENFRAAFNKLNSILNVEQAELIFNDEPDKYFIGTKANVGDIPPGKNVVVGEIEFYCADPFKYSVEVKEVVPTLDSGTTFAIDYNGSYKAFPRIEATMKSDVGYIGFANQDGRVLQFGNVNELEGENYKQSESLISVQDGQMTAAELNKWEKNVATLLPIGGQSQEGTLISRNMATVNGKHENVITLSSRGGGTGFWKGGTMTRKIGADSEGKDTAKNFLAVMKHAMMLGTPYQVGITQFMITTKDKKNLAGINFIKNNLSDKCDVEFFVNGIKRGKVTVSAHADPKINHYMHWNIGHHSITKSGDTITFYFGAKNHVFRVPEVANKEAYEVSYGLFALDGYDQITVQAIRGIHFRKDNVQKWRDVPNKFANRDSLEVDTGTGNISLDRMQNPSLGALGNDWEEFYLRPGTNQIKCLYSGWAKQKPDFKLKYREVYL